MGGVAQLSDLLAEFAPVTLDELDERAALLRRVDHKYVLPWAGFERMLDGLRRDHEVLQIDGGREFGYRTTYFDTDELRCFTDHVGDRLPRFKVRTRAYEDSGECVFEVKLKRSDDETDKRQLAYDIGDRRRLTEAAWECVRTALDDAGLGAPLDLGPTLETTFRRVTLAATGGPQRLTCDLGVRLTGDDGRCVQLRDDLVLVETKSEDGASPADRLLREMEQEPVSLSKYRVGMSLAGASADSGPQPGGEFFA